MIQRRLPLFALALLSLAPPAQAQTSAPAQKPTERWYEIQELGQKVGFTKVTWAPSTWQGKKTVHDTTTVLQKSVRNMAGYKTVFETTVTLDLERGRDGTLYTQKTVVSEAGRLTIEELTWTPGTGYVVTTRIGKDAPQKQIYPLKQPVVADAEAFLSDRIRAGKVKVGDAFTYRSLDARARTAKLRTLKVVAREAVKGAGGAKVECLKLLDQDPASGNRLWLWVDAQGAFVQLKTDRGTAYTAADRKTAEGMPARPAEFRITTPSSPPLERVFSADRMQVKVHLQGDPNRELPTFPPSPWSKVTAVSGSNAKGWVVDAALTAYDDPKATARLPLSAADRARFKRELEPTPLMPSAHATLIAKAKEVLGGETDARKAAYKLARYVHTSLRKESPDVASTTALEILREGRGDCSEHCVLFVTLCRAAGIPARRCSGYVNIGSMWGAHAWAEVWVGAWIGADPTTGEVGTHARYLFFGYPDRADSYPSRVSDLSAGRLRFVSTRLVEGGQTFDLTDPTTRLRHDKAKGHYLHVLAGLEFTNVPTDWRVGLSGDGSAHVNAKAFSATVRVQADQGDSVKDLFGRTNATYGGLPAYEQKGRTTTIWVHARRRLISIRILGGTPEQRTALEKSLAPTFATTLVKAVKPKAAPAEKGAN